MSEMIEIVAKAIEAERTKIIMAGSWTAEEECRRFAEAAIRAMRDPTKAMIERGFDAALIDIDSDGTVRVQTVIGKTVWHYMVDAALSSPPSKS